MKLIFSIIQTVISLPLFWVSMGLLILACAINPALYSSVSKNFKNLGAK